MAGAAGPGRHILAVGDLARLVDRMARDAGRQRLAFGMRLVTGETGRFEAVGRVACHAGNPRVLARVFDKLVADGTVALETGVCELGRLGDLSRRVRIRMAGGAVGDPRSVGGCMA